MEGHENFNQEIYLIYLSMAHRNVLGTRNLSEILTEREAIARTMQTGLDEATGEIFKLRKYVTYLTDFIFSFLDPWG